ncbi:hypothetical protein WHR41_04634 [Cladosporium halotolerans]|uniref:Cell wall galactomannoprotein n=1 Tax=Cladosporium halotolerans TaxID=1052096 RepID=A0AB34KRC8_9PEZI
MHLPTLATTLLLPFTTLAASLHRRTIPASTIIQDIENIHQGVLANTAATEAYDGGNLLTTLVTGTPVLATVGAIHVANRKGFVDANLAPQYGEADTRAIFDKVVDTVAVSIPAAVEVIVGKKEAFEDAGLGPVVLASLRLLIDDHDTFSAAVTAKSFMGDAELTAEGEKAVDDIHDAIQRGIDAYSS